MGAWVWRPSARQTERRLCVEAKSKDLALQHWAGVEWGGYKTSTVCGKTKNKHITTKSQQWRNHIHGQKSRWSWWVQDQVSATDIKLHCRGPKQGTEGANGAWSGLARVDGGRNAHRTNRPTVASLHSQLSHVSAPLKLFPISLGANTTEVFSGAIEKGMSF